MIQFRSRYIVIFNFGVKILTYASLYNCYQNALLAIELKQIYELSV